MPPLPAVPPPCRSGPGSLRRPPLLAGLLLVACGATALCGAETAPARPDDGVTPFSLWVLLGRLHPMVVHFPIVLIMVVALIEAIRWWRREPALDTIAGLLVALTALSAVVTAGMGWLNADDASFSGVQAATLAYHRWLGVSEAGLTVLVAGVAIGLARREAMGRTAGTWRWTYRGLIAVAVVVVSAAGHFGGKLSHGEDYISSALPAWAQRLIETPTQPPRAAEGRAASDRTPSAPLPATVDFVSEIQPLLEVSCIQCHGPRKHRGGLRLDSRAAALAGGDSGPSIVIGHGATSLCVTRMQGKGDDPRMPKGQDPISPQRIDRFRLWIDQGAPWPAGLVPSERPAHG
jgi:uncharacterized membrane protein/mono/diheme cytochrome c family protein